MTYFFDINHFPLYVEGKFSDECTTLHSNISIDNIENKICVILDKYNYTLHYFYNLSDYSIIVEFNNNATLNSENNERITKFDFEIKLFKSIDNKAIITFSRAISEFPIWSLLYEEILKKIN
jgi:hypothetical protein